MMNKLRVLGFLASVLLPVPAHADSPTGIAALEAGDVEAAAAAFQQAFEEGDGDGAFYLGRMFELGLGTEPDLQQAAALVPACTHEWNGEGS